MLPVIDRYLYPKTRTGRQQLSNTCILYCDAHHIKVTFVNGGEGPIVHQDIVRFLYSCNLLVWFKEFVKCWIIKFLITIFMVVSVGRRTSSTFEDVHPVVDSRNLDKILALWA